MVIPCCFKHFYFYLHRIAVLSCYNNIYHAFSAPAPIYSTNVHLFSMKCLPSLSFKEKAFLWSSILLAAAWTYYDDFFEPWPALVLALVLTSQVVGMLFIGYFFLGTREKFPRIQFWLLASGFTLVRFLVVFFVLQHHLPEWTVFHYPGRSLFFLFFTSAAFLFIGYSYAIYEWGLAAREKFVSTEKKEALQFEHPITIRSGGTTVHLLTTDILYLEANGEYVNYHTVNGNYLCFQRMKQAERELKAHAFVRVHRSYIVNPEHVQTSTHSEIGLKNGVRIPISKGYKEQALSAIGP